MSGFEFVVSQFEVRLKTQEEGIEDMTVTTLHGQLLVLNVKVHTNDYRCRCLDGDKTLCRSNAQIYFVLLPVKHKAGLSTVGTRVLLTSPDFKYLHASNHMVHPIDNATWPHTFGGVATLASDGNWQDSEDHATVCNHYEPVHLCASIAMTSDVALRPATCPINEIPSYSYPPLLDDLLGWFDLQPVMLFSLRNGHLKFE
ncbi:hypothetical protein CCUS01_10906 [Colletotrichum cuscutae]|uniref:Uncharacterized protein n=1 Tax=Colletotrichum cuscutae TaxID=1209917 RepID=A0AAI9XK30_9PEZI|nr:hypothetical protein CCUS01_10906 [Colletotrichum cuscutae]